MIRAKHCLGWTELRRHLPCIHAYKFLIFSVPEIQIASVGILDDQSCSHLAMWPAWPAPWPPPTPPPRPPPGPRSSPRQRASSSVNFCGLKKNSLGLKQISRCVPLPEFWDDSAAKFHPLESLLGCLHVIVNGGQARLYLLKLL